MADGDRHDQWNDSPASREPDETKASDADDDSTRPVDEAGPSTSPLRIAAVEAAVAAGLAPSTSTPLPETDRQDDAEIDPEAMVELPAWTDPPTGQVPRVLLDEGAEFDEIAAATRGPSWRQESADWDEEVDLSVLASDVAPDESSTIAGQAILPDDDHPFSFGDLGLEEQRIEGDPGEDDQAWEAVLAEARPAPSDVYGLDAFGSSGFSDLGHRARHRRGAHRSSTPPSKQDESQPPKTAPASKTPDSKSPETKQKQPASAKNVVIATTTGIVIAAIAAACFLIGSLATLVLAVIVLVIAAGEIYSVLQRVGFRPATLVGLGAVAGLVIGAYLRGTAAIPFVLALAVIATGIWYLSGRLGTRPAVNFGATFVVISWVGVLGSFAGLLLSSSGRHHGHGVALIVGAVVITIAHDVGSYFVGSRFGRHSLAPTVSPNKTIEGLLGGTILAIVAGVAIVDHLHPFGIASALELAVLVAVLAPLGDLAESLIKRDLGVKDMGNLLPGHGGVIDRVDAMLFVLPATYYLASLHHFV